jgi:hypothetical protein
MKYQKVSIMLNIIKNKKKTFYKHIKTIILMGFYMGCHIIFFKIFLIINYFLKKNNSALSFKRQIVAINAK